MRLRSTTTRRLTPGEWADRARRRPLASGPAPPLDLESAAQALHDAIERAATIVVASEPLPDGDAFGAELAVRAMIQADFGLAASREDARAGRGPKLVELLNEHAAPPRVAFLDGASVARAPTDEDRAKGFDLAILVDGGLERCGAAVRAVVERCRARAYVDHHQKGSRAVYDVTVLDPRKAATTELLAALLETQAFRGVPLSRGLAEALYLGLVSDTGSFAYSLTTPATHRLAARILETGARTTRIHELALLETTIEDLKTAGQVFAALETELDGTLLVGVVRTAMLGGRAQHLVAFDKIVTPMAFVKGVEMTLLIREVGPNLWKISLRSQGHVDVSAVARALDPEGGGHARAAGGTLAGDLASVRTKCVVQLALHHRR